MREVREQTVKTPIDTTEGRIVGYDEKAGELLIRAPYDDYLTMTKREYKKCLVQLIDNRPISDKQRRTCYMILKAIDDYTGMGLDPTKQYMKIKFLADEFGETADKIFSLANAPMSLVASFQRFLVRFVVDYEIPCEFRLADFIDDISDYVYCSAIHRRCAVCGRRAELHHWERVGIGRDRNEINHIGMEAEPLCRQHHTECHTMPQEEFDEKYHIEPVKIDKAIATVFRLNKKGRQEDETDRSDGE